MTTIEPKIREIAQWSAHANGELITLGTGIEDTLEEAKEAAMKLIMENFKENSNDQMHAWVEHMKCTLDANGCQDKVLEYGNYRIEYNDYSEKQWVKDAA